jgi:uncharacterized Fe-S cluster protein YjdI
VKEPGIVKRYSNGEVTVIWRPSLCQHSGVCVGGLPEVFDSRRRPWIELRHADSKAITDQVERCPSGALAWERVEPPAKPGA